MLATASPTTNRLLVTVWAAAATVWGVLMYYVPGQETVPFHLIWISLALVYGFTRWRPLDMVAVLVIVTVATGVILAHHAAIGEIRWEETTEVPLMAGIFGVMVWHVHRRNQALAEVRRLAETEHRRLERQQMFVRLASHELRTPITIARGYTEMVRRAHTDPSTVDDTAVVLDELDKLGRITQRLVTLMQIEAPHPIRRLDLDAKLQHIRRRWEPAADRTWVVRADAGHVHANVERLEAALDCLVENAVKFTAPGDRIELVGRRAGGDWLIEVHDSGTGMAEEEVSRLLSLPPRRTATGTGLGLAIVRAVVEALHGTVHVHSEPGRGTTVTMRVQAGGPEQPEPTGIGVDLPVVDFLPVSPVGGASTTAAG